MTVQSTGPYIVRVESRPEHDGATGWVVSVQAVADLGDARQIVFDLCEDVAPLSEFSEDGAMRWVDAEGGSVDLSDSRSVVVEKTTWEELWSEAGRPKLEGAYPGHEQEEIRRIFNELMAGMAEEYGQEGER